MTRFAHSILILICCGCSGSKFDAAKARTRLQAQAEEVRSAMIKQDHERIADLTYPFTIKGAGGRANFIQHLNKMAADTKKGKRHFMRSFHSAKR